jgi:hypothetical protein
MLMITFFPARQPLGGTRTGAASPRRDRRQRLPSRAHRRRTARRGTGHVESVRDHFIDRLTAEDLAAIELIASRVVIR